ncbi:MAG: DMT family transporter, partial [Jatrophihabitantaceae bacterium]
YLLIRVAVRYVEPGTLVFLRTGIGGLILLPLALRAGGFRPVLSRWRWLLAFTVIELAIPWLLLGDAERHLSSSLSGLLVAAVPRVAVLVARVAGSQDRADRTQWAGLLLVLLGVAMLVGLDLDHLRISALLEVAVVVVGYAVAPMIMARRLADLPSIPVVSASLLLAALGYLPYALLRWPSHVPARGVGAILVLGTICTALAFVLFFALINAIGPGRATVITYVNPAVAVVLGLLVLDERFTVGMAIGFPLILLGSVLAARSSSPASPVEAASPEAALCEVLQPEPVHPQPQSIRTVPEAVWNSAAIRPASSSVGADQSTATPSRES